MLMLEHLDSSSILSRLQPQHQLSHDVTQDLHIGGTPTEACTIMSRL